MNPLPPTAPVAVELRLVELVMRSALRSAHGTEVLRQLVVIRVELADGSSGWGECSALTRPTYTGEYAAGAWIVLAGELVPALLGGADPVVVGHPMAAAGLAAALTDARLRRGGRRLVVDLGARHGRPLDAVPWTGVVGRHPAVADTVGEVDALRGSGASMVKLKVTPHPVDLEAVAAVRATWPDLAVAVDANGSLDRRSASILDALDLAYIEQPRPGRDLLGSAELADRLETPVALDESITGVEDLALALTVGAGSIVNVKPARLGGLEPAAELARAAIDGGARAFVGGMWESGIGRCTALALAALPTFTLPCDLGPTGRYLQADITGPLTTEDDGRIRVPAGPGFGVEVDADGLDAVTVDRRVIER